MSQKSFGTSVSGHLPLAKGHWLSAGIQTAICNRSADFSRLLYYSQWNGSSLDPSAYSGEANDFTSFSYLDAGLGMNYRYVPGNKPNLSSGDFAFMGEEYPLQVGNQDFAIDLLFYNRSLNCMVAIELKNERFKPEHLGQLNFYLEALDQDVKKEHENPSIGILLCKGKDDTVVEYAMNRSLSPTLIADYKTKLPNKALLQQKWEEVLANLESETNNENTN
jgi:hypothetical protein